MRYVVIGLCVFAAACAGAAPTSPTSTATTSSAVQIERGFVATPNSPSTFSVELQTGVAPATVSCTVDIGSTVHSLPLIQLIQAWLNISINNAASSLNCGQVKSLNAKLNVVAEKVDQDVPNADAACGASTALVNELQALVEGGRLATPTLTPPRPGGPTNVLMAAEALMAHWCDVAH
jgi:hypothetical protein